jgi:uncharacterized damage-inducible protein DinB
MWLVRTTQEESLMTTQTQPTTELGHYLAAFEREYQITLRVLKAYPPEKAQLKFTDRSHAAAEIAWTLVVSQAVVEPILTLPKLMPSPPPPIPGDWKQVVAAFEKSHADALKALAKLDEATFTSPIVMPVGPGQTAPVRRADALWMMLFDTVHHRGQFSVYLRASGAKVPSIYGSSGDEPWF